MVNAQQMNEEHILTEMMRDGFGFDEVLAHLPEYSRAITGHDTPTGRLRVEQIVRRMERRALGMQPWLTRPHRRPRN